MRTTATLSGFLVLWLVLDRSAASLGSYRGEWGLLVALLTATDAVVVESLLSRCRAGRAAIALGQGWARWAATRTAVAVSAITLAFFAIYAAATHEPLQRTVPHHLSGDAARVGPRDYSAAIASSSRSSGSALATG